MKRRNLIAIFTVVLAVSAGISARETWVGLGLRFQPVYIETNNITPIIWGLGAEGSWFPHKRLMLEGRYSSSVLYNEQASDYKSYYQHDPDPKLKPFTYWEVGGQLNLVVNAGNYENKVTYDSVVSTEYIPSQNAYKTTYVRKKGPSFYTNEYRLYGIRGGIIGLQSAVAATKANDGDSITTTNGINVTESDTVYTNLTMTGFYAGVVRTRVFYSQGLWNSYYIDVLVSNKLTSKDPELKGFSNEKIGGRFGFEGARRHFGGRVEGGVRPGLKGFYLLVQAAFGFML